MAKMKSISGIVHYVKDTAKTTEFYEKLGFTFSKRDIDGYKLAIFQKNITGV